MSKENENNVQTKTTSHRVVIPFYLYAAFSLLIATILLFTSTDAFLEHYFHPHILAITHLMALGWGTMVILGASHQLIPVLIDGKLYSTKLAYTSFILSAIGIPLLVYGFYTFNMGPISKWGGRFVVLSVLTYLINLGMSISKSKNDNIHSVFIFTAAAWLFITTFFGLTLVYNFTTTVLPENSVHYLPLHAHTGIIGWFLMLVIGVSSRLIPMFQISKYTNVKLLWIIYSLLNISLLLYTYIFHFSLATPNTLIPGILLFAAILLFIYYCYNSFKQRIRKQLDEQMKISLLSVVMILLPVILLLVIIFILVKTLQVQTNLATTYGFLIFFGWLTAIILGMTFKTLPFIVWNKLYHQRVGTGAVLNPKELFNNKIFTIMSLAYIAGFALFVSGILLAISALLLAGASLLLITAVLYNWNVILILTHKPETK